MNSPCETSDLLVFSHLRWDFVFQRPQHLLSRFAKHRRVFYFEEPVIGMTDIARLHLRQSDENVQIVVPYLPAGMSHEDRETSLKDLVDELVFEEELIHFSVWYYTPKAFQFSRHLNPQTVIFDCVDEFSFFEDQERELMKIADVIFASGRSLYEAKKAHNKNIYLVPSSVDYNHFSQARLNLAEPEDQLKIPHPRIGFYGTVDERFDIDLFEKIADMKPEFQFVIVGPVIKIDPATLPLRPNIHYLGKKEYHSLPLYVSGWDCAMMPMLMNDSTRFTNPTKTPEFLAAGKPVVSTSIHDVVHPYADAKLVYIADQAKIFVDCIEKAMNERAYDPEWLERVDAFLDGNTWDATFIRIANHETEALIGKHVIRKIPAYQDPALSAIGIV